MAWFRDIKTLQRFASSQSAIHNHFNLERRLVSRSIFKRRRAAALAEWRRLARLPEGYRQTFCAGVETFSNVEPIGLSPGRLIRG